MKQTLYFESIDANTCQDLEYFMRDARLDDLKKIKLIEAVPDFDNSEYIWCSHEGEVTERFMCKKSECAYYSSKSGRGVCEHRGRLYQHGEEVEFEVKKNVVTKDKFIEDMRSLFNINEIKKDEFNNLNSNDDFMIDKRNNTRDNVITSLQDYFIHNEIKDHFVTVDSITLLYTVFRIKHNKFINDYQK